MWFEESSWSNLRLTELVEEWRDLWPSKIEFVVSAMSYLFAMTNFLNMPKLILQNGGLAFVSAYGAILAVLCLPTIILEMAVGQVTGRAPVLAFYHLFPVFKGIGVAQILFSLIVLAAMTKFLSTLSLFLYYFFWTLHSAKTGLPWLNCRQFPEFLSFPCREAGAMANFSQIGANRMNTIQAESSMMQFLTFLERPSESIADFNDFRYPVLIAQSGIWIFVFIAICFGVRFVGKTVSFLLFIALSSLIGLFIRCSTLGGVSEILEIYWKSTDWQKLEDIQMWKLAAEQAILGTGIGFGAFITMSSYMRRNNNLVWDSMFLTIWHAVITFVQTVTVICLVGYVSMKTGIAPSELLDQGETQMWYLLAYVSYLPRLWTGVILVISICTMASVLVILTLSVLSTVEDAFGENWSRCCRRFFLALFLAAFCFSLTLYFSTNAGRHAYELTTGSIKYVTIYAILAVELFATAWLYCAHKLGSDLHTMMSSRCCSCFGHFFLYFTYLLPVIPAAIVFFNAQNYNFATFSAPIHEWKWSEFVVAGLALGPLLVVVREMSIRRRVSVSAVFSAPASKTFDPTKTKNHRNISRHLSGGANHSAHSSNPPRYTTNAPGYRLLPQAPLAEPEIYA
ncbi:unnamed protein product [Caenorhabditis angaria]|uniref:Sodium:neurotransmitter symporter family protein n=1 Tax=Caenorhabditis angaria TaxID=860376 RepID=A0A9P1MY81_9PELO|nr:unnamed protein product [Caenorhabditis angaria]